MALDGISVFKLELRHAVQFLIIFLGRMWNGLFSMRIVSLHTRTQTHNGTQSVRYQCLKGKDSDQGSKMKRHHELHDQHERELTFNLYHRAEAPKPPDITSRGGIHPTGNM